MYTRQRRANGRATTQNDCRDVDAVAKSRRAARRYCACTAVAKVNQLVRWKKRDEKQKVVFNGVMNVSRWCDLDSTVLAMYFIPRVSPAILKYVNEIFKIVKLVHLI